MLAIAGGKGGSGKTTTALGLAHALARRGRDPVVLDCDSDMPSLHHRVGERRRGGVDALAAGTAIERAAMTSDELPGVRLIAAGTQSNVPDAIHRLKRWHGPVILDCPPGTGPDAITPLRTAHSGVLVTTETPQSVADTACTAACCRRVGTAVHGVIVRQTVSGEEQTPVPSALSPVLARVDTAREPLQQRIVRTAWNSAIDQIQPL